MYFLIAFIVLFIWIALSVTSYLGITPIINTFIFKMQVGTVQALVFIIGGIWKVISQGKKISFK